MTALPWDVVYRDFVIEGMPASGPHHPHKKDIRDSHNAQIAGPFPDNRVIRLNNANEGTPNNIIVSAAVAIPVAVYQVLYILNVTQENTGPVTVSGAINRKLITNDSEELAAGYILPGMAVLCIDTGTELRMLSFGDVESAVEEFAARAEAAEAAADIAKTQAQNAASDAVSQGNVPIYSTRNTVETLEIPAGLSAFRTNGFNAVGDGGDALYIRAASEPTHGGKVRSADGAWWELAEGNPNFFMFGAVDDGISANDEAWGEASTFCASKGFALKVSIRDTGTFNFAWRGAFTECQIAADDGVIFSGTNIAYAQPTQMTSGPIGLKRTDADGWKHPFQDFKDLGSELDRAQLSAGDLDLSEPRAIDVTQMLYQSTTWPTVSGWSNATTGGMTRNSDVATFNLSTLAAGGFVGLFEKASAGSSYSSDVTPSGIANIIAAAFIRTANYWMAIYQDGADGRGIKYTIANVSAGTQQTGDLVIIAENQDQLGYQLFNSNLGVAVLSPSSFSVAINGVTVLLNEITPTAEVIEYVGFGFFKSQTTGSVTVNYPIAVSQPQPFAPRPVRMVAFGDSITDPGLPGWPVEMTQIISGSLGCQVETMVNIAVSGHRADQQLAAINAANMYRTNLAVGMVGTNDIQQATNLASFVATIDAIILKFRTLNIPLVLGIPPLWWSKTEGQANGNQGFSTPNSSKGAVYRSAVRQRVAKARANGWQVGFVDFTQALPPMLAQYQNWNSAGNRVDPLLYDNVHPTMRVRRWMAFAFARKALSLISSSQGMRKNTPPTTIPTAWFRNNWGYIGGYGATYWLDSDGLKHIAMTIKNNDTGATNIADGTQVMVLPIFMRPAQIELRASSTGPNIVGQVQVNINGSVTVNGINASNRYISVDICFN